MSRALCALYSAVRWSPVRALLWLLAALCALPASAANAKERHALVIGVGGYSDANGINRLVAPANDADEMRFLVDFQIHDVWIRFMSLTCRRLRPARGARAS